MSRARGHSALILASGSPRRAELLQRFGVSFRIVQVPVVEVTPKHLSPEEIAMINAHRKARAVAHRHPDQLVLGADTVVSLGRMVLGKPADRRQAQLMLKRLQGRTHHVITGVCLLQLNRRKERLFAVNTAVSFRRLSAVQIRDYLAKIDPLDKAGGYAIQDRGDRIAKAIHGSFSNVVGLPLERLQEELNAW